MSVAPATPSLLPQDRPVFGQPESRSLAAVLFTCALFALGQSLQVSSGTFHPRALEWLTAALIACLAGVLLPPLRRFDDHAEMVVVLLAGFALAYQMAQLLTTPPGWYPRRVDMAPFQQGLAIAAVIGGAGLAARPWLGRLLPWLLVAAYLYVGAWVIRTSPNPFIDVHVFQRDAVSALFAGENPWALRYPDIYGGNSAFYGEGLSVGGKLQFGFPYPPLSLFFAALGNALAGDHRYAQLACTALTGLLVAHVRPGRVGNALAAVFLFTPRGFLVVEQGWTEPYVGFGLAATVLVALRWPRALPYVLGAFLSVKQYLVLAVPFAWLLLAPLPSPRARWVAAMKVVAVGALLTLPFALWDFSEFWRSVVSLQVHQPFRKDSLSYLAWWTLEGDEAPSSLWAFAITFAAIGLSLWRLPRTPYGFAAGMCLTFLVFFAFNKQAFCNYYYFAVGSLAVAAASALGPRRETSADA